MPVIKSPYPFLKYETPKESPNNMGQIVQAIQELRKMHQLFLVKHQEIEKKIADIKQGPPGRPGKDGAPGFGMNGKDAFVDEDAIVRKVLSKIKVPTNGKDGRNGKDTNPDIVRQKVIQDFNEGKVKLSTKHIDGWQDAHEVVRRFVAGGSIRGGGDTVVAGSGVSITSNTNGNKVISATGSGITFETPTGTVDGANKTFTVLNTPKYIVVDGVTYFENNGYVLAVLTITTTVAPTGYIRSAY